VGDGEGGKGVVDGRGEYIGFRTVMSVGGDERVVS